VTTVASPQADAAPPPPARILPVVLPAIAALSLFGTKAFVAIGVAVLSALAGDIVMAQAFKSAGSNRLKSACLGLLTALMLPATTSLVAFGVGGLLAAAANRARSRSKAMCWHPALIGWVGAWAVSIWLTPASAWGTSGAVLTPAHLVFGDLSNARPVDPGSMDNWRHVRLPINIHALRCHTPAAALRRLADGQIDSPDERPISVALRRELPAWEDTLLGGVCGGMGETCTIAILATGLLLIYRGSLRLRVTAGVLAAAFIAATVLPIRNPASGSYDWFPGLALQDASPVGLVYCLYHLTSGSVLFAAIVLAANPEFTPSSGRAALLYGLCIGAVAIFMRLYGIAPGESYWALAILSPWVGAFDRYFMNHSPRGRQG